MPIAVQGICDLEVRIGKEKISLGSVVIADIGYRFQCPELLLDARAWLGGQPGSSHVDTGVGGQVMLRRESLGVSGGSNHVDTAVAGGQWGDKSC